MSRVTNTFNNLMPKPGSSFGLSGMGKAVGMGAGAKLFTLLLLFLVLPLALAFLGVSLVGGGIASVGGRLWRWIVTKPVLTLLVLASAVWIGFAAWIAYNNLRERQVSIAAGARTAESYALAQALQAVAARHYPRISVTLPEIEGATELLEKGLVQLAIVSSDMPTGPSAQSVVALTPQSLLLARSDVDKRVIYVLTQTLLERGPELAGEVKNDAVRPLVAKMQKPSANAAPLHPGAAAYYERDKTRLVYKYPVLSALALAGLVIGGGWGWEFGRRLRRKRQAGRERQEQGFAGRAPWSFSRILEESAREAAPPMVSVAKTRKR